MADTLTDTEKKTAFNPQKQPLRVGDFRYHHDEVNICEP